MRLDYLEEVPPSCCRKAEFGQELIHEFLLSGKPAALVRMGKDGDTDVEVIRVYSKLRTTALRTCGERVSVMKRGHSIYLKRNEEWIGGKRNG